MFQKQTKKPSLLHRWLIPSSHNKKIPHLIRPHGLILLALLVFGVQGCYNIMTSGHATLFAYETEVTTPDLLQSINASRANGKVSPLKKDAQLTNAAALKANDMIKNQYWAHQAPSGTTPWHWFDEANYSYQHAGENLAKNFHTPDGVTNAWILSRAHRENLLNPDYKDVGVAVKTGIVDGKETTFIVALFGTPKDTAGTGSTDTPTTEAPSYGQSNILASPARIQTLATPLSLITIALLLTALCAALLTHWHYLKLPKPIRKSWYTHHALYTSGFMLLAISYFSYVITAGSI